MAGEWLDFKIGDLFDLKPGYAFKSHEFVTSGAPVLKIKNVKAGSVVLNDLCYVDPIYLQTKKDYVVNHGDILITLSGNRFDGSKETWVGKVGQFLSREPHLLNQRVAILRPKSGKKLDQRCCSYILGSDEYQTLFIAIATSSGGQANLSSNQVLGAGIRLPPYDEQSAIAAILGALDDKIELNRRMNATLENMARALFQSWFVDFDPVRAKMDGRQPVGMDKATASLFPSNFQDSDPIRIPHGWKISRLDQIIELCYGKALKATDRVEGHVPVYGSGGITGYHNESLVNGPSVIVGRKGTVGSLYWEDCGFYPIDTVFYVRSTVPMTYCFYLLQTLGLENMNTDAAVPGLNRENAYRLTFPLPGESLMKAFDEVAGAIRQKMLHGKRETGTLAALRDTLLPKLLSGELRIKDAERFVSEVV